MRLIIIIITSIDVNRLVGLLFQVTLSGDKKCCILSSAMAQGNFKRRQKLLPTFERRLKLQLLRLQLAQYCARFLQKLNILTNCN